MLSNLEIDESFLMDLIWSQVSYFVKMMTALSLEKALSNFAKNSVMESFKVIFIIIAMMIVDW